MQVSTRVLYLDGRAVEQEIYYDRVIAGIRWTGWIPLLRVEGPSEDGSIWAIYGGTVYGTI